MNVQVHQAGMLTGRSMVMVITIALHAVLISAVLAIRIVPTMEEPIAVFEGTVVEDPQAVDPRNKKPVVQQQSDEWIPSEVVIDKPVIDIVVDEDAPPREQDPVYPPAHPGAGAGIPVLTAPTPLAYRAMRPTDDYYPPSSIRLGETGVTQIRVCVSALGEMSQVPSVVASSGSPRLDTAALAWVREALRFTPATQNGVPVASCKGFRVNFTLR